MRFNTLRVRLSNFRWDDPSRSNHLCRYDHIRSLLSLRLDHVWYDHYNRDFSLDISKFGMPRYVRILHVRFTVAVGYECRLRSGSSWSRVSYQCTSTGDTYSPTCHLLNSFLKFNKMFTNTRQAAFRQTTSTTSSIKGQKSCRKEQKTTDSVFQFILTTELFDWVLQRIITRF